MDTTLSNEPLPGFEYWDEHPAVALDDWRYQVANDETRLGYWQLVRQATEDQAEEEREGACPSYADRNHIPES